MKKPMIGVLEGLLFKNSGVKGWLSVVVLLFPILGIAQDGYNRDRGFDVKHYVFELELSDRSDSLYGKTSIDLKLTDRTDEIQLDLVQSAKGKTGMTVSAVSALNFGVSFKQKKDVLYINLGEFYDTGKEMQVVVEYSGIPADGLIIGENKFGDRTFFGDNWPNRAHHWLPLVDHPYDKATLEFKVTAPEYYSVVSNGALKEISHIGNGQKLTHWISSKELPTKVMVVGVARFAMDISGEVNGHEVSAWVYPQEREKGFYDYARATDILRWFEKKIAPYPYEKLANVQSKTRYGGMENAGCIFYHENSIDGKRGEEPLLTHEIAHQWFGNSASEADWHHVWLSEGFATYLTEVFKQDVYGEAAFDKGMNQAGERVKRYLKVNPKSAIIDTNIRDLNRLLTPSTYQKAAWFLHTLRSYVGDRAFWTGVKEYYETYQYSNAWSEDLREMLEKASGKDLKPLFDTWLYNPGIPTVAYTWEYDEASKKAVVQIIQEQDKPFALPVQIEVVSAGDEQMLHDYLVTDKEWKVEFPMDQAPKAINWSSKSLLINRK
ncbi:M1 family metallopeptidase [bacterium SCSIO 12741]|nr:M1 family metallopeptidase [bacterium SCSIO 12741]